MPSDHLDLTADNILDIAKRYSLHPVDQAPEYRAINETHLGGNFAGFRHTLVDGPQKVARINVTRNPQSELGGSRGADFLVRPSLNAHNGTPSYFLPWDSRGAAVEMTIPRFPANGGDAVANPPIFFTAVLSGCSIIFKGTQAKPTIFHCGTAGGDAGTPTQGDSNDFFRRMLRDIKGQGLGRSNYNVATQIRSTDYMHTRDGGGRAPRHESRFQAQLESHYQGTFYIENVSMWGTVFGFRTGVNWEFYLQENATINYRKVDDIFRHFKARGISILDTTPEMVRQANNSIPMLTRTRPAVVTKVFPEKAHARVMSSWRTLRA